MALPQLTDKGNELLIKADWICEQDAFVRLPAGTDTRKILHFLIGVFANTEDFPIEAFDDDLDAFCSELSDKGIELDADDIREENEEFEVDGYLIDSAGGISLSEMVELRDREVNRVAILQFTQALRMATIKMLDNDAGSSTWDRAAFAKAVIA